FERVGDENATGYQYLATADDNLFVGEMVMNHAADLGALLCLGATTHLVPDADRPKVGTGLKKAFQVFRNWNLDHRRENEWKMLVLAGTVSEKRGDGSARDPGLPTLPSDWSLLSGGGEATANAIGWAPLLRHWVDMARRPAVSTTAKSSFKPGDPTNAELSRALAYLLDMRDP